MAKNDSTVHQQSTTQYDFINDIISVLDDDSEMSTFGRGSSPSEASVGFASADMERRRNAYIQISEQPQAKAIRFRYLCEGRSAGSIPGVRSVPDNKTYPTIRIIGYKGPVVVVVSCVTVDPPYRPHPHNLVGRDGCSKGVCTLTIENETMEHSFSNLGIQCVKKKEIEEALRQREAIRVDPFMTGFAHKLQTQSIDLNAVRLCFQVFIHNISGKFTLPLTAVVSDPIYDKKAAGDLVITKLSHCTGCVSGGEEIILLCEKVSKDDIKIEFYEAKENCKVWSACAEFSAADVHKQYAITFKTPRYHNFEVQNNVKCFIQLVRPSDGAHSAARPFLYIPKASVKRKPFEFFAELTEESSVASRTDSGRLIQKASKQPRFSNTIKTEPIDNQIGGASYGMQPTAAMANSPFLSPPPPSFESVSPHYIVSSAANEFPATSPNVYGIPHSPYQSNIPNPTPLYENSYPSGSPNHLLPQSPIDQVTNNPNQCSQSPTNYSPQQQPSTSNQFSDYREQIAQPSTSMGPQMHIGAEALPLINLDSGDLCQDTDGEKKLCDDINSISLYLSSFINNLDRKDEAQAAQSLMSERNQNNSGEILCTPNISCDFST